MNGAFAGCGPSQILPVVSAAAKVIDAQGLIYAAIAHEVLYDDNPPPVESLLSTHHNRKISMKFALVSCCTCVNNLSSS